MNLKELIKDLNCERTEGISDCEIKGISCDSNKIAPGHLFVAIKGQRADGHSFINQAIAKGAKAVIAEQDFISKPDLVKLLVQDSRAALACVCSRFFGHPAKSLKAIGITGTNGKTTVAYLIESILASAGHLSAVTGTINYRIGSKVYAAANTTPQADILQSFLQETVLAKSRYVIIEVSSHALAQHRVDYIDFSQAVFTNLSGEHLDYHGSLNNYFSCKSSLFERLSASGVGIINVDDHYGRKLANSLKSGQTLTFSIDQPARIQAKNIKLDIEHSRFRAVTPQGDIEIESPLIGRYNIYNVLAAIAVAFIEKIDFSHIASAVKGFSSVPGRLERVDCGQDFLAFIDYAHTDDALANVLRGLRQLSKNKIILVFGCGGDRDRLKRPRMGKVASELTDVTIITSDNPRSEDPAQIAADIIQGIDQKTNNCKVILDRFRAIRQAVSYAQSGDILLIAGKGHESTQVFADKTIHFSDREVIKEILRC
ncbi:MAG: UDP-N-acetylmuramoyl-L-alanyl-D-glutamate--2,6-diaminopimelate ligase [Omnitrophica bacterium]|nr:UDP-N-acetylmuramoyl-L-alanyl-D-glutamate--2,6-diaminopimelate ligase [Candidatus Omnitrophota bacterium]